MKLFENKVGRPTNEIKDKRRKFIISMVVLAALLIGIISLGIYSLFANVNTNKLSGKADNFQTFAQNAESRKNKIFCGATGKDGLPKQTFGNNACGPTALAMAVKNMTGENVTPESIASEAQKAKYCHTSKQKYSVSTNSLMKLAKNHNLEVKRLEYNSKGLSEAKAALRSGKYILAYVCSKSPYTRGYHWLVLYGIDGNTVKIGNPYGGKKETTNINNFVNKGWIDAKGGQGWFTVGNKQKTTTTKKKTTTTTKKKTQNVPNTKLNNGCLEGQIKVLTGRCINTITECKSGYKSISGTCKKVANFTKGTTCPDGFKICKNQEKCNCYSVHRNPGLATKCIDGYKLEKGYCVMDKYTGWFVDNTQTNYYVNGETLKYFQQINKKYYYFNGAGKMQKGFIKMQADGKYRYFDNDGAMVVDKCIKIGNEEYCFDTNGICIKGSKCN